MTGLRGSFFGVYTMVFVALEMSSFYSLWFDSGGCDRNGLQLCRFRVWRDMEAERDLFALLVAWVANVKLIMCLLLVSVLLFTRKEDHLLRASVSLVMSLSIHLYFLTMSPGMHLMENAGRLDEKTSFEIDIAVSALETSWVLVFGVELFSWWKHKHVQASRAVL